MPVKSALKEDEKVSADDPRLFNMGDLARILGVERSLIRVLKSYGFKMPLGRATVAAAHRFIEENEEILAKHTTRRKRKPANKPAAKIPA